MPILSRITSKLTALNDHLFSMKSHSLKILEKHVRKLNIVKKCQNFLLVKLKRYLKYHTPIREVTSYKSYALSPFS